MENDRLFDAVPRNVPFCVPVISDLTITLLPSWRTSFTWTLKSGKVVISSTSMRLTPSGPVGAPGAAGMSSHLMSRTPSSKVGAFSLKALYQIRTSFLYVLVRFWAFATTYKLERRIPNTNVFIISHSSGHREPLL